MEKNVIIELPHFSEVREYLKKFPETRSILLDGNPGVGKTTSVYAVAKELGYNVIEYNASDSRKKEDLEKISTISLTNYPVPTILLIDEADGITAISTLNNILNHTLNPIILTANASFKMKNLTKRCKVIKVKATKKSDVVKILKLENFSTEDIKKFTSSDIRSSLLAAKADTKPRTRNSTDFDDVSNFFLGETSRITTKINKYWLMDNAPNFLHGTDLYIFYTKYLPLLSSLPEYLSESLLKSIPFKSRGRPEYPTYFRTLYGKKKEDK